MRHRLSIPLGEEGVDVQSARVTLRHEHEFEQKVSVPNRKVIRNIARDDPD